MLSRPKAARRWCARSSEGDEFAERWENAATVATGIRVPKAVGDFLILRAVRESGGAAIAVSEEAILQAVEDAARDDGFLFCPEGGAVLAAGARRWSGASSASNERVLLFNCANGNKYPLPDRSKRLKLAEASRERSRAHKRVNPGNRSCRGSMLRFSFELAKHKTTIHEHERLFQRICVG